MRTTFGEIIQEVLRHEGGYVNDSADKGGETKYGISKRAHNDVNIKTLTVENACSIYREHYWVPSKAEKLPEELREAYFLFVVNAGQGNAVKVLQKACNGKNGKGEQIGVDGRIGRMTLRACQSLEKDRLISYIILYYGKIVYRNASQERFWYGWYRRALGI
jgi:lysozyme family protein